MSRGKEFAALVHSVLILDNRYSLKQVASHMDMSYDALYSRLTNRTPFSADEIRRLITHVPDVRLAAWLLEGTDYIPASRPITSDVSDLAEDSLRHTSIMMLVEASEVAHQIEKAIADNRIDHREAKLIQTEIEAAERAIATVKEHVNRLTE